MKITRSTAHYDDSRYDRRTEETLLRTARDNVGVSSARVIDCNQSPNVLSPVFSISHDERVVATQSSLPIIADLYCWFLPLTNNLKTGVLFWPLNNRFKPSLKIGHRSQIPKSGTIDQITQVVLPIANGSICSSGVTSKNGLSRKGTCGKRFACKYSISSSNSETENECLECVRNKVKLGIRMGMLFKGIAKIVNQNY
jgi:hypothetical protein